MARRLIPSAPVSRRLRPSLTGVGRVAGYLRPYRGRAMAAGTCVIVQALLDLAPVLIFRTLIDRLARPHPNFTGLIATLGLGLAVLLMSGLISVVANYLSAQISESVVYDLRQQLYEHLVEQSVGYFTRRRSGDVMSNLINDVDAIERVLSDSLLALIRSGCLLVAMVALMFVLDWRLAILTILVVPALAVAFRGAGRIMYRSRLDVQEQLAEMSVHLQETLGLSGLMLVKAFARGGFEKQRFAALNSELRRRQVRAAMAGRWFAMALSLLQAAGPMLLLLVGGLLITRGSAGLGTVLAFSTIVVGQFGGNLQGLGSAAIATAGSLATWERVFAVLDERPEIAERPGARAAVGGPGAVRFDDVTFTYTGAFRPALQDVTVDIEPGQLVALVGPSGAGKTTFSGLLARFIDPQAGSVKLDGVDLRDITLESLHRSVGIVFQDSFLFHTTLRENLRYGRPDASDEEIWEAVREANLADTIEALPAGLDTLVGERGHRLSGGEKQRVAIARVMLKDPRILLLDEATAHLDNVSERLIQAALKRLFVGRTSLVIAHRLSTITSADQIFVLDAGHLVERGTHEELLAGDGLYARLHGSQMIATEAALN